MHRIGLMSSRPGNSRPIGDGARQRRGYHGADPAVGRRSPGQRRSVAAV